MKAQLNKQKNCWEIKKGRTVLEIYNGTDRPWTPVKIKYEDTFYTSKKGLIDTLKAFEVAYSEEQVLAVLLDLV